MAFMCAICNTRLVDLSPQSMRIMEVHLENTKLKILYGFRHIDCNSDAPEYWQTTANIKIPQLN